MDGVAAPGGSAPQWPMYYEGNIGKVSDGRTGQNLVFQTSGTIVEKDDWRADAIDYMNEHVLIGEEGWIFDGRMVG